MHTTSVVAILLLVVADVWSTKEGTTRHAQNDEYQHNDGPANGMIDTRSFFNGKITESDKERIVAELCLQDGNLLCSTLQLIDDQISALAVRRDLAIAKLIENRKEEQQMIPSSSSQEWSSGVIDIDKRTKPALSVDAPLRTVSDSVHRHQVKMTLALLRQLGKRG